MRKIWKMKIRVFTIILFFQLLLFNTGNVYAQTESSGNPLIIIFALSALSLAPFVLIMVTSFVKISVVLSLIRRALGLQQTPSNQVINGLAIIMSIYIMLPVGSEIYERVHPLFAQDMGRTALVSENTAHTLFEAIDVSKEPLREFLLKNTHGRERKLFYSLALRLNHDRPSGQNLTDSDFIVLVPAFVISELKEAFQIGFIIYIPFIIIDMVVSNILLAMGMMMLSPVTVSLPFKLLLFVLVDGWLLISKGLVMGYL